MSVPTGAQHKTDEVDSPEQVANRKVSVATEDSHATVHQATDADTEVHSEAGEMIAAAATTFRTEGIRATSSGRQHCHRNTRV